MKPTPSLHSETRLRKRQLGFSEHLYCAARTF